MDINIYIDWFFSIVIFFSALTLTLKYNIWISYCAMLTGIKLFVSYLEYFFKYYHVVDVVTISET